MAVAGALGFFAVRVVIVVVRVDVAGAVDVGVVIVDGQFVNVRRVNVGGVVVVGCVDINIVSLGVDAAVAGSG